MTEDRVERRKAQRVDARLNLEVRIPLADGQIQPASLETLNISSNGIYFRSDHFIEPMTKLGMSMELNVPAGGEQGGVQVATLACEGIVVRTTPEEETPGADGYEIAVFFTHIQPEGLKALEDHIAYLVQTA
jgi:hypothetical protein